MGQHALPYMKVLLDICFCFALPAFFCFIFYCGEVACYKQVNERVTNVWRLLFAQKTMHMC